MLVPIRRDGSGRPLFILHGLHGQCTYARKLVDHFSEGYPVYGIQARGMNGESAPNHAMDDIARDYVEEIRSVQPQGPYRFGGYCAGGMIAIEMADILRREGDATQVIVLIDPPAAPWGIFGDVDPDEMGSEEDVSLWNSRLDTALAEYAGRRGIEPENMMLSRMRENMYAASRAIRTALIRHKPRRTEVPIRMISNTTRARLIRDPHSAWRQYIAAGSLDVLEPGADLHQDLMHGNPKEIAGLFERALMM